VHRALELDVGRQVHARCHEGLEALIVGMMHLLVIVDPHCDIRSPRYARSVAVAGQGTSAHGGAMTARQCFSDAGRVALPARES
jgi:hypothetical protein